MQWQHDGYSLTDETSRLGPHRHTSLVRYPKL